MPKSHPAAHIRAIAGYAILKYNMTQNILTEWCEHWLSRTQLAEGRVPTFLC